MKKPASLNHFLIHRPFWSGFISLSILFLGLLYFNASVIEERFFEEQVANHNPDPKPAFFWGRLQSSPAKGYFELKDLSGGIVRFSTTLNPRPGRYLVILQGYMKDDRTVHVLHREDHANIILKFGASALALGFLLWKLFQTLNFTKSGLQLTHRKNI